MTEKQTQTAQLFLASFQNNTREYSRKELLEFVNKYIDKKQWQRTVIPIDGSEEVNSMSLTTHVLRRLIQFGLIEKRYFTYGDRDDWYLLTDDGKRAGDFRDWLNKQNQLEHDQNLRRRLDQLELVVRQYEVDDKTNRVARRWEAAVIAGSVSLLVWLIQTLFEGN